MLVHPMDPRTRMLRSLDGLSVGDAFGMQIERDQDLLAHGEAACFWRHGLSTCCLWCRSLSHRLIPQGSLFFWISTVA